MHQTNIHNIEENKELQKDIFKQIIYINLYKSTYNEINQHIFTIFESANNVTI